MSEEIKKNLEHLKNFGKQKKQQQTIKMTIRQSQQQAEDEESYDSEEDYSEQNDLEEYMMHMDDQVAELKEMIVQLSTVANTRSYRIERRLNFALRKTGMNKRRKQPTK